MNLFKGGVLMSKYEKPVLVDLNDMDFIEGICITGGGQGLDDDNGN